MQNNVYSGGHLKTAGGQAEQVEDSKKKLDKQFKPIRHLNQVEIISPISSISVPVSYKTNGGDLQALYISKKSI